MEFWQSLGKRSKLSAVVLVVLTLTLSGFFAWRAGWRALSRSTDFAVVFAATRAWVAGENPYDRMTLERQWGEAGGRDAYKPFDRPSLYPPTTFVLFAPIARLHWPNVRFLWMLANVAAYALTVWLLLRWAELPVGTNCWWTFVLLALALAAAHGAVSLGQMCIVPMLCVVVANRNDCNRVSPWLRGVLLGIATALKPQMGGLFWLMEAYRRRWRAFVWACITLFVLAAVGSWQLQRHGVDFVRPLLETARKYSTEGFSDPSQANPFRHEMLNLQVLVHGFVNDRTLATAIAGGLLLTLGLACCPLGKSSNPTEDSGLLETAAVSVLTLLVVYHRSYDAVLLLIPAALFLRSIRQNRERTLAVFGLATIAVFLAPGSAILYDLEKRGRISAYISNSWLWRNGILLHQAWAIVLLGIVIAVVRFRSGRRVRIEPIIESP